MPDLPLPQLPPGWSYFVTLRDVLFLVIVLVMISLLITWWRQQSSNWFRVVVSALLGAILFCIGSYYVFVMPPYSVGCATLCTGWRGFPRPIAVVTVDDLSLVGPLDFSANLLLLWLILLTTTVLWRILITGVNWEGRSLRTKFLLFVFFWIFPWALLPRFISPPQPIVSGEDLRVANNALRAAEFTYNITGLWVQRLALEDVRSSSGLSQLLESEATSGDGSGLSVLNEGGSDVAVSTLSSKQVCLKGYTFFFLPWRRYRLVLEASGVSSVQMVQVPLSGSCWS